MLRLDKSGMHYWFARWKCKLNQLFFLSPIFNHSRSGSEFLNIKRVLLTAPFPTEAIIFPIGK